MNDRHRLFVLALLACLAPATAFAQVSDTDRAAARALGQEGHEAADRKDWATAADRFARADALLHAPTFSLGLAQAQVGLGKLASALDLYDRILREPLPPSPPPAFTKAVETARQEREALAPRVPHVTLRIAGAPAPAVKLTLDGAALPSAAIGAERPIDPGRHVIRAEAPGLAPAEVVLAISEGRREVVTLEMKPAPMAPPPIAPAIAPPPIAPVMAPPPAAPNPTQKVVGIVQLALGGAGLVLGGVTGGLAIAKHADIAESCPDGHCPLGRQSTLQPRIDGYRAFSTVSTTAFVAGGLLAGAGAVLLITAPGAPRPAAGRAAPRITLTPVIGPAYAGAHASF